MKWCEQNPQAPDTIENLVVKFQLQVHKVQIFGEGQKILTLLTEASKDWDFFFKFCCILRLSELYLPTFFQIQKFICCYFFVGSTKVFNTKRELKFQSKLFFWKYQCLCFHHWDYLTNFWPNNWQSFIDVVERLLIILHEPNLILEYPW